MKKLAFLTLIFAIILAGCGTSTSKKEKELNDDYDKNDYLKLVSSNNDLGFQMIHLLAKGDNENVFVSPTSLMMALSMLYNGADGDTKEELAKLLASKDISTEELNKANASLLEMLKKDAEKVEVNIANSLWINDKFEFQDEFVEQTDQYYLAELQEIDILDPKAAKLINDWVSDATKEKITEIVDDQLDPSTVAILINAIYFNGKWEHEFNKDFTEDRVFYLANGEEKEVPFMTLHHKLDYLETDEFQAVKLPYGEGEMSMNIFLPKEDIALNELVPEFTAKNWKVWENEFEEKEGSVYLPKFSLEYETILNDLLIELGVETAFTDQANLEKLVKEAEDLYVSQVKQKTYIDVDEEGTEAAAVTSIEVKEMSAPVDEDEPFNMEVNRPFLFTITDNETNTNLFVGAIQFPEQK